MVINQFSLADEDRPADFKQGRIMCFVLKQTVQYYSPHKHIHTVGWLEALRGDNTIVK